MKLAMRMGISFVGATVALLLALGGGAPTARAADAANVSGSVSGSAAGACGSVFVRDYAATNNRFGLAMLRQVMIDKPGENVFVSPTSAVYALSMLLNGAGGLTQVELNQALRTDGLKLEDLNRGARELMSELLAYKGEEQVRIANSIWASQGEFNFYPEFRQSVQRNFGGEAQSIPFDNSAAPRMNAWVNQQTNGLVPKIFGPEGLDPRSVAVLLNAFAFEGIFQSQFKESDTATQSFHVTPVHQTEVQMMHDRSLSADYLENAQLQLLSVPIRRGEKLGAGDFRVDILLPKGELKSDELVQRLSADSYGALVSGLRSAHVDVSIPKFSDGGNYQLNDYLQTLGAHRMFSPALAELHGVGVSTDGRTSLFVTKVKQAWTTRFQESGVAMAASTSVELGFESMPAVADIKFTVDRPFLVVLRHVPSGALLHIGNVNNPQWKEGAATAAVAAPVHAPEPTPGPQPIPEPTPGPVSSLAPDHTPVRSPHRQGAVYEAIQQSDTLERLAEISKAGRLLGTLYTAADLNSFVFEHWNIELTHELAQGKSGTNYGVDVLKFLRGRNLLDGFIEKIKISRPGRLPEIRAFLDPLLSTGAQPYIDVERVSPTQVNFSFVHPVPTAKSSGNPAGSAPVNARRERLSDADKKLVDQLIPVADTLNFEIHEFLARNLGYGSPDYESAFVAAFGPGNEYISSLYLDTTARNVAFELTDLMRRQGTESDMRRLLQIWK